MDNRERAVAALETLGGKLDRTTRDKHGIISWVHSPARPKGTYDKGASVYVYPSGFYKDFGGFEECWKVFGLGSFGTVGQLEAAAGKTSVSFDEKWQDFFPPKGRSLKFIEERLLNKDMVGGDNDHVYFPLRNFDNEIKGIQTRSLTGKQYKLLEGASRDCCFHPQGLEYDTIYITEGATDTFSLCSFLPNVVGTLSASWLTYFERFPTNKTYISLLDNDEAGYQANLKLKEILPVQFVDFRGKKDVNEWLLSEPKTFLALLTAGTRASVPFYDTWKTVLGLQTSGIIGTWSGSPTDLMTVLRKTLQSPDGQMMPFQLYRTSPLSLGTELTGVATNLLVIEDEKNLQEGVPIVTHTLTQLQADWLAYKFRTKVYVMSL